MSKLLTTRATHPCDDTELTGATVAADGGVEGDMGSGGDVLTKKSVQEWVNTNLSGHLVPKYVFWTSEYPKTASGKIQKFKLRDLAVDMLK